MNKILKIRTELGWTQTQLGDYLGVDYHTIGKWQRGAKPSLLAQKGIIQLEQDIISGVVKPSAPQTASFFRPQRTHQIGKPALFQWLLDKKDRLFRVLRLNKH